MKHIFITYGDNGYEAAKARLVSQARTAGVFDEIYALSRNDLSKDLLASDVIKIKRGGGLWSWKPDVVFTTMCKSNIGDIIVYCDAGCTIYPSREWYRIWKKLEEHDIIAQRIYQRTKQWTRREIVEYFSDNGKSWLSQFQYQATFMLKVSKFSKMFIQEWRDLMIEHPEFAMDVPLENRKDQLPGFIENRHDQAVYSALIYKYLNKTETKGLIYTQWEHIEDYDPFFKQAIRATRLRQGQEETSKKRILYNPPHT